MVFHGNTFENNIGLHGGAIHINNQQLLASRTSNETDELSPPILIKENLFRNNMAYFEGNAIYIKSGINP